MTKYRLFLVGKRSNLLCAYAQNEPMGPLCIPIDNNGTHRVVYIHKGPLVFKQTSLPSCVKLRVKKINSLLVGF